MKNKKTLFIVGLILISFLYLFVRLQNLDKLLGFRLDQGVHLLETKEMVDSKKIKLVGPMVTSKSFMGRNFFIGANYYYVLGIIGWVCQWNPLIITIIFIFLELVFYLFFILFLKRNFNSFFALLTFVFITVSPYLIIHSRFFWNPHLLIPLSILVLLFSEKYFLKKQDKYLFLMAFCWGFAFACHYSAVFWGLFFIFILVKSKQNKKLKSYFIIIVGFILGNLPFFVFEILHNFYNIKTIFYIFINSSSSSGLASHYFVFPLLIFIIFGLLSLLFKMRNKININIILVIIFGLLFLIQIRFFSKYNPLDVIPGWSYPEQQKVTELIIKNGCPKNFNIASTISGDTRSYDLRFLLTVKGCKPMGVEEYSKAEKVFLIAPVNRPPAKETVWEVSSLGKFKINRQENLNPKIIFYELEKIKE